MKWRLTACVLAAWLAAGARAPGDLIRQTQSTRERLERAYAASNRGVALLEQFDYPAAADAFRQALAIEPSLGIAHLDVAIALLYAGDTAAAAPQARTAAAALPAAPQPPYVLGLIARADNRGDDAEAAFRRVLQIDSSDAGANVNLGQLLLQSRRYTDAIGAFRAAVNAEPYNATAAYGLATALMRSGDAAASQAQMKAFQTPERKALNDAAETALQKISTRDLKVPPGDGSSPDQTASPSFGQKCPPLDFTRRNQDG